MNGSPCCTVKKKKKNCIGEITIKEFKKRKKDIFCLTCQAALVRRGCSGNPTPYVFVLCCHYSISPPGWLKLCRWRLWGPASGDGEKVLSLRPRPRSSPSLLVGFRGKTLDTHTEPQKRRPPGHHMPSYNSVPRGGWALADRTLCGLTTSLCTLQPKKVETRWKERASRCKEKRCHHGPGQGFQENVN